VSVVEQNVEHCPWENEWSWVFWRFCLFSSGALIWLCVELQWDTKGWAWAVGGLRPWCCHLISGNRRHLPMLCFMSFSGTLLRCEGLAPAAPRAGLGPEWRCDRSGSSSAPSRTKEGKASAVKIKWCGFEISFTPWGVYNYGPFYYVGRKWVVFLRKLSSSWYHWSF